MKSPAQVRAVCQSLVNVMNEQQRDVIDRAFLELIIQRCNEELGRKR
jgi:hypothetical protein